MGMRVWLGRSRGAANMPDYRLYCLDGVGKITSGEWIEATGDAEAIMIVRTKKLSLRCELWHENRLVATFERIPPDVPSGSVAAGQERVEKLPLR